MATHGGPTSRKRVLCVTSYELFGDAASWRALNTAEALQERGYLVLVNQYVRQARTSGSQWERCAVPSRVIVSSRLASFYLHHQAVSQGRHDVVIANSINGALFSLLGLHLAPLILDMHGDMVAELEIEKRNDPGASAVRYLGRRFAYQVVTSLTCRLSSRISCVSHSMMEALCRRGITREKLVYVPNGVDLRLFNPSAGRGAPLIRHELGIGADQVVFGYIGRFHPWQGVENFVEAARTVEDNRIVFLIVGGRETRSDGKFRFVQEAPVREVPGYYGACDVLVLPRPLHPATAVAAPTKFAEYAAMGKPILTTDVGDAARFIREYGGGLVVKDNSPPELAQGIRQMASLTVNQFAAMGSAARRLAEMELDLAIGATNLAQCIEKLVAP